MTIGNVRSLCLRKLLPDDGRAGAQRLELAERGLAREVFHSAIGRWDETFRRNMLQAGADALGHALRRLDRRIAEIDDPEHDGLALKLRQDAEIELGLRCLDGNLLRCAVGELRQE